MKNQTTFTTLLIFLSFINSGVFSHKISGSLICESNCVRSGLEEADQTLTIMVQDVSLADAVPTKFVADEIYLSEAWSFPLKYEIEIDGEHILKDSWKSYIISARIFKNGALSFVTDTRNDVTNSDKTGLRPEIDMNVVRVKHN